MGYPLLHKLPKGVPDHVVSLGPVNRKQKRKRAASGHKLLKYRVPGGRKQDRKYTISRLALMLARLKIPILAVPRNIGCLTAHQRVGPNWPQQKQHGNA